MTRRFIIMGVTTTVAIAGAGAGVAATSSRQEPDRGSLSRLQGRIERDGPRLARTGIYVQETGRARSCVTVWVVNPTTPNVDYLRRRFGKSLCIERASIPTQGCSLIQTKPSPDRREVPDLLDLGLYEAERRAVAAGFTYTNDCHGLGAKQARRPSRFTPESLVRITAQCPAPGTQARVSEPIALQAEAVLPGGFTYMTTAFRHSFRSPRCVYGQPQ
jgi:hypothetical protein